ncbi:hypothetical protein GF342_02915 [Candidatus Woesearchaeota archaeon]|nr:hypothetical protein [Candidatus Woesearchaeota archaeon]
MKKFLFSLLVLLNLSLAFAAVDVTFHGTSASGQVNEFDVYIYDCLDSSCTQYRDFSGVMLNGTSTTRGELTVRFPDSLATPYGYALFAVADEMYRPMEYKSVVHSNGQATLYRHDFDIEFSQITNCRSLVHDFSVLNDAKPNIPVVMQLDASLDAQTVSAFKKVDTGIGFVPGFLDLWYSAETEVTLTIVDENGGVVHEEQRDLDLYADERERVQFTWTPRQDGRYSARVQSRVTDPVCQMTTPEHSEKYFAVLDDEPVDQCYTLLNNLELSNAFPRTGDVVTTTFNKLSNWADGFGVLTPVATALRIVVMGPLGNLVYDDVVTMGANADGLDPVAASFSWAAQQSGLHTVAVSAIAQDNRCSGLTNDWEVISTSVYVDSTMPGEEPGDEPKIDDVAFDAYIYVTDELSGEPVDGADILLDNGFRDETNDQGVGHIDGLVNGVYSFKVKHDEYETVEGYFVIDNADATVFVELELDEGAVEADREVFSISMDGVRIPNAFNAKVGSALEISVNFDNDGDVSLDDARAAATILELGVHDSVGPFDLDAGDSFTKRLFIPIPDETEPGTYYVRLSVGQGKNTRIVHRMIRVTE